MFRFRFSYPFLAFFGDISVSYQNTHQADCVSSVGQFEFCRRCFLRWGKVQKMVLLLNSNPDFSNNMQYFSPRQRSHFFAAGEHDFALSRIVHSDL